MAYQTIKITQTRLSCPAQYSMKIILVTLRELQTRKSACEKITIRGV